MFSAEILIVDPDRTIPGRLVTPVQAAGFGVALADDFACAVEMVRAHKFYAIVTAQRLGAHNGLHVVMRARRENPAVIAIVTSPLPDPVLEREAALFDAVTVVAPWLDPGPLLLAISPTGLITS